MRKYLSPIIVILIASVILLGACGGSTPAAAESLTLQAGGLTIKELVYSKALDEKQGPIDPGNQFEPLDTIYLTVTFKGRPKEGLVLGKAYWKDQFIAEATINLADVNSGLLFSIGSDTYAFFNLTPSQQLPISKNYRFEIFVNDEKLGDFPFAVVPPANAIETKVESAVLAKGLDENFNPIEPSKTFAYDEDVFFVALGPTGIYSWFAMQWVINDEVYDFCYRDIIFYDNYEDNGFYFTCLPEGGWPIGSHEAVLYFNDEEIGRYPFTIQ